MKSTGAFILSSVAIVLAIIAICVSMPRADVSVDYLGMITGMLGILVTVLIGWNIYTIIDFKQEQEKLQRYFEEQKKSVSSVGNNLRATFMNQLSQSSLQEKKIADIYAQLMGIQISLPLSFYYLFNTLGAIVIASQAENFDACNLWVKEITQVLTSPQEIQMPKAGKQRLIDCMMNIQNPNKIEGLGNVMKLVATIGEIPDPS